MKILKRINNFKGDESRPLTVKYRNDKLDMLYKQYGGGKVVATYIVEGQVNNEIHLVKNNGLIEKYDAENREFISVTHATKNQLKQYFKKFPSHLFEDVE